MTFFAIPMNLGTFAVLITLFGGAGFYIGKGYAPFQRWWFSLLFGSTAALAVMAVITAIGFIPDDWSASRLTWPGGLFYGYRLYPGENGPSNGFFYPPVGAWFYLPAAGLGILFHSPTLGLLTGWCMSMACLLIPLLLLITLVHPEREDRLPAGLLSLILTTCLIFSCPQLRYVATMIHVDAPALLFLGLSLVLILPVGSTHYQESRMRFMVAGASLALAVFSKQSIWPIMPLVVLAVIFLRDLKAALLLMTAALSAGFCCLAVMLCFENMSEAFRMIWLLPSHRISITSPSFILRQILSSNIPIVAMIGAIFCCPLAHASWNRQFKNSAATLFVMAFWMIPFAIFTRMSLGADWNHLAIPSYLALLGCLTLFPQFLSHLLALRNSYSLPLFSSGIALLMALALSPYLSTCCGWYLWTNNSHQLALKYELSHLPRTYFPWQTYSMLIAEGKLYHIDDCLKYEAAAGWNRSDHSLRKYFPEEPFQIAIRPFGAPSFIAQEAHYEKTDSSPPLKGWEIFRKNP